MGTFPLVIISFLVFSIQSNYLPKKKRDENNKDGNIGSLDNEHQSTTLQIRFL